MHIVVTFCPVSIQGDWFQFVCIVILTYDDCTISIVMEFHSDVFEGTDMFSTGFNYGVSSNMTLLKVSLPAQRTSSTKVTIIPMRVEFLTYMKIP